MSSRRVIGEQLQPTYLLYDTWILYIEPLKITLRFKNKHTEFFYCQTDPNASNAHVYHLSILDLVWTGIPAKYQAAMPRF